MEDEQESTTIYMWLTVITFVAFVAAISFAAVGLNDYRKDPVSEYDGQPYPFGR